MTGPTPPGTGVIAEATRARGLEVDVADELVADHVDSDVDDHRPRAQHLPGDQARNAGGHDHDLGVAGVAGEVDGLAVADRDGGVLAQHQQGGRLADDVGAADDVTRRPASGMSERFRISTAACAVVGRKPS